jgi:hypothetical protein
MPWPKVWGHRPFAEESHTHIETDITDLGPYAADPHTHEEADIIDLDKYTQSEADALFLPINEAAILTVNGTYSGKTATVTIDDGDSVFSSLLYQGADFHYDRALADAEATMPGVFMALEAGLGSKLVLREGQICNTGWNWSSGLIYASDVAAGGLLQVGSIPGDTGDQVQIVGWALSAVTIYFKPNLMTLEIL